MYSYLYINEKINSDQKRTPAANNNIEPQGDNTAGCSDRSKVGKGVRNSTIIITDVYLTSVNPLKLYHCHLDPLPVANCSGNSQLILDEDDIK